MGTKTGESCTKAVGKLKELNISKLCGRRSTQNGQRGQRPNCQNGSESAQARNPESPNLPRMTKKEVKLPQLKLKRKKRKKKRKRRKNKRNRFLQSLPHPKRRRSWFFSGFSIIFFSDTICVSLQSEQYKKDVGTSTTLKHRKKDTSTKEVFHSYPTLEKTIISIIMFCVRTISL